MIENIAVTTELLEKINRELNNLEVLLNGQRTERVEHTEELKENCVSDTVIKGLKRAEDALCTLERINIIFRGGNN